MMGTVSPSVPVRRPVDRSHHRKPLRVQITRRRKGQHDGAERFVTQVRFGGREAVVVPWELSAVADGRASDGALLSVSTAAGD